MAEPKENPYASPLAESLEGEESLYQKQLGNLWYQRSLICFGCAFSCAATSIALGGIGYAVWGNQDPPLPIVIMYVLSFLGTPLGLMAGNVLGCLTPSDKGVRGWSIGGLVAIVGVILSIVAQFQWPIAGLVAVLSSFFAVAVCDIY